MNFSSIRYLFKEGLKNVWSNRMMSFASIGVLVSCLLLTGAALLFSLNISSVMKTIQSENSVMVYLKQDIATLQAVKIGGEIQQIANVNECEFVSQDEALQKYSDILGPLFQGLEGEDNFLPNSYRITMKDLSLYQQTIDSIKQIEGIDSVSNRSDSAQKLTSLNHMVTTAGFWIILVLSIVSLFIISNTIRVTMYSRRLEISIMKSVGATNWFIRVPFIVEGIIIGLISAVVSTVLLKLLYDNIIQVIKQIIPFNHIPFNSMTAPVILGFGTAGVVFGALGGVISIGKYLKKEGGEIIGW